MCVCLCGGVCVWGVGVCKCVYVCVCSLFVVAPILCVRVWGGGWGWSRFCDLASSCSAFHFFFPFLFPLIFP